MKTLLLELDESIYTQVINFLTLLPKKQCHIIESPQIEQTPDLDPWTNSAVPLPVVDTNIDDFALNHDHYLYGSDKQ